MGCLASISVGYINKTLASAPAPKIVIGLLTVASFQILNMLLLLVFSIPSYILLVPSPPVKYNHHGIWI